MSYRGQGFEGNYEQRFNIIIFHFLAFFFGVVVFLAA